MEEAENKGRVSVSFAAIDPYIQTNMVLPTEKAISGKDIIQWGDGNGYPDYLAGLVKEVPTLASIISGNVDFITGDDLAIVPLREGLDGGKMNNRGDTIRQQVADLARDYETFGGFALQVIRDFTGAVAEVYYIDMRYLRTNKECDVFWYSEKWDKGVKADSVRYPAFIPGLAGRWATLSDEERDRHASSILYVKNTHTQVYPFPPYGAAVKACETERCISDFHLNAINNGFVSSAIVNFNKGVPIDSIKDQIEEDFSEKFTGHQNAGRVMFSWNDTKENATEVVEFKVEDFGERYKALAESVRQQIFTAFRAYPNLFGIPTATGFSMEEFEQSWKLYNRTHVRPVQRIICDAYDRIYGATGVLTIKPFSLNDEAEQNVQ